MNNQYVFLTTTYDDKDKIFGLKKDVKEVCKKCVDRDFCSDIKDGCGCLMAYCEICWAHKPIFYGNDLKEFPKCTKT